MQDATRGDEGLTGWELVGVINKGGGGGGGGGGGPEGEGVPSTPFVGGTAEAEVVWRFGFGLWAGGGGGGGATIDLNSFSEAGVGVAEVEILSFSISLVKLTICSLREVISPSFLTRLSIVRLAISSASISDSFS
jgi:hypothetical protein